MEQVELMDQPAQQNQVIDVENSKEEEKDAMSDCEKEESVEKIQEVPQKPQISRIEQEILNNLPDSI